MNDESSKTAKELNIIMPEIGSMKLNGVDVQVSRIRVKQIFALIRILKKVTLSAQADSTNLVSMLKNSDELISSVILSLDTAEDEVYKFLDAIIIAPEQYASEISAYIGNGRMEIEEISEAIRIIISQEKDSFGELIKKVQSLAKVETKEK